MRDSLSQLLGMRMGILRPPHRNRSVPYCLLGAITTAVAYYVAADIGEALAFPSAPVSALWAPNAILLAALVLTPPRLWWLPLSAVCVAHFAAQLLIVTPMQAVIQYVANCGVALIGAAALWHLHAVNERFDRLRPMVGLIVFGGILAPLATSFFMAGAFVLAGLTENFWLTAVVRTVTNTFAILTLVPLIVNSVVALRGNVRPALPRVLEAVAFMVCLTAVGVLVFIVPRPGGHPLPSLLYVPFPVLLWAVVRFSSSGVCVGMLLLGGLATWGVLHGNGPFLLQDPVSNALSAVIFLVVTTTTLLLLTGLMSERKTTTAALLESESQRRGAYELHSAILASIQDQVAVVDCDGNILRVNEAWRVNEMRGRSPTPGSLKFTNYFAALAASEDELAGQVAEALKSVLSGRASRRQLEYAVRTPEGVLWLDLSIEPLIRAEGGAVLMVRDATDRKNAVREAHMRHQQLAHLSRVAALGEISGAIAHEVNQPLAAILGNAEAALRLLAPHKGLEDIRQIVEDIVRNEMRAAEVIKRVRSLLQNRDADLRPLDLNGLALDVLTLLRHELMQRNVTVQTELADSLAPIEGDSVQLQQVILNLAMNACEAMNGLPVDARRLYISTRHTSDGGAELAIRDTGRGIPTGETERIFHPFVSSKPEGLGLGLSISRSIIKAHRGKLWAESSAQGATFRMLFPASRQQYVPELSKAEASG
jgi:signal transduction histidine kinase